MGPLLLVLCISAVAAAFAWIASLISHEHSWVDRLWSVLPVVYVWLFALAAGLGDTRLTVMAILVTAWGLRLTYNFARKGGYRGVEDYRWAILRERMSEPAFAVFNLLFIVVAQNAVLVLIALPAWTAYRHPSPFGAYDIVLTVLFVGMLVGETVADQQQWAFQLRKRAELEAGRRPRRQFLDTGLFRCSRHPNYFFELAQWWIVFLFGAVAADLRVEWTLIGPVLLTVLFVGSTRFTEAISAERYRDYADYQERTSMIVPWWPRKQRG